MSVFAYNPELAKAWSNNVVNYLNGGSESISACTKKFAEQIEKLVQPNMWTGAAAAQNYQNFLETNNALVAFANRFGGAFEESMNALNRSVQNLEVANLGSNSNVSNTFGSLSFDQLTAMSEENINVDVVRYDYATISGIGTELANIHNVLEDVYSKLTSEVNKLNSGESIWDGDAAESAKGTLVNVLKTNMDKVNETLNICISNISKAAEAAQNADRA